MKNESSEIVKSHPPTDLQTSIEAFEAPLESYLNYLGLPFDDVLHDVEERRYVINNLHEALSLLPMDQRERAKYLSKFTVAIVAGIFDGALNYLWDETVAALRRLVLRFDLEYFFSIAEKVSARHKGLSDENDLDQVGDHDLLEACRRIGLLTDVDYQRLAHVNYMRNHSSAAHPNENEIDGAEMISWLKNCLKCAITAEPNGSVIEVKRLLDNVRTQSIPEDDAAIICAEVSKLAQERIDDVILTLFGMFTDPRSQELVRQNIEKLAHDVWAAGSEDRKYEIGARFGVFRKNGDVPRKELAERFLVQAGGQRYKDEDSLAGELLEKLESLKKAHFGLNNFYNEYPHARALKEALPATGAIPRAARPLWVKVISLGFIGNGCGYRKGVDEAALPYYTVYINHFGESEAVNFVKLFNDPEFTNDLSAAMADKRARELAAVLLEKQTSVQVRRGLKQIIEFPTTLNKISSASEFKRILTNLPGVN